MTQKLLHRLLIGLGLLLALTGLAAAGQTLKVARGFDSKTFDPILTQENADAWPGLALFSGLVRVNKTGDAIEPALAESWTISPDGKTYTFKLRPELKFSNGAPLTSRDVRFSLLRARDTKESPWTSLFSPITDIKTPDEHTVLIELEQPSAVFLSTLGMYTASIVPEDYFTKTGAEQFAMKPVGAGAFILTEWRRGDRLIMSRNPHYWEAGKPKLDTVEWIRMNDDAAGILALQAGAVDMVMPPGIPFGRFTELAKTPDITAKTFPSTYANLITLNEAVKPFDDVRVRQAIYKALDREAITKTVTFGLGSVANSIIAGGGMFWNKDNPDFSHDLEGAKALLKEAGVSNFSFSLIIPAGESNSEQTAVMMQAQLAKAGITMTISRIETNLMWDRMSSGEFEASHAYWTYDTIDPDPKLTFTSSGDETNRSYFSGYKNPKVTALLDQGRAETDPAKRKEIYFEVQKLVKQDAPQIDLYYTPFITAFRNKVKNVHFDPLGRSWLEDVTVEP